MSSDKIGSFTAAIDRLLTIGPGHPEEAYRQADQSTIDDLVGRIVALGNKLGLNVPFEQVTATWGPLELGEYCARLHRWRSHLRSLQAAARALRYSTAGTGTAAAAGTADTTADGGKRRGKANGRGRRIRVRKPDPKWLTVSEAATIAACANWAVTRWANDNKFKTNGKTRKQRRIDSVSFNRFLLSRVAGPEPTESNAAVESKWRRAQQPGT